MTERTLIRQKILYKNDLFQREFVEDESEKLLISKNFSLVQEMEHGENYEKETMLIVKIIKKRNAE